MSSIAVREVDLAELEELRTLEREEERLRSAVDTDMHAVTSHVRFTVDRFGRLMEEIEALNNELEPPKPPEPEREPPTMDAALKRIRERQSELKTLYRRLRQRCHPDKTADVDFIETYHLAEEAYERGDLEAMRALSRSVGASRKHGRGTSRADRVRARLILVRERVVELRGTLGTIRNSVGYKEMEAWKRAVAEYGKEGAERVYESKLKEVIAVKKQQLAARKQKTTSTFTTYIWR